MAESGLSWFGVFRRLNPRQKRCAALLVSGYSTNIAIAKRVGITSSAVANNISQIMDACGVFSRLNLVLFIVRTPGLQQELLEFEERVQRETPVQHGPLVQRSLAPSNPRRHNPPASATGLWSPFSS